MYSVQGERREERGKCDVKRLSVHSNTHRQTQYLVSRFILAPLIRVWESMRCGNCKLSFERQAEVTVYSSALFQQCIRRTNREEGLV